MWVFTMTLSGRFHFFVAEKKVIIHRIIAENNLYICRKVLSADHEAAVGETPGGHAVDECEEVADMVRERNVHGKRSQDGGFLCSSMVHIKTFCRMP